MEACGFLFRVFFAIFLGICVFSCSCDAASPCPIRAVPMYTPEGVKCVCKDAFYGDGCKFRAKNSFSINATWAGENEAWLQWEAGGLRVELFKLFTRKVKYDVSGSSTYGKWRAGVQSRALNAAQKVNDQMKGNGEDGTVEEVGIHLQLDQSLSWEIRVIVNDQGNESAAIFIDPPMVGAIAFALQDNANSSKNNSSTEECPWYSCPGEAFGFFFDDFNKPSYKNGMIVGAVAGVFGTITVSASIYIVVRLTIYCCSKKKHTKSRPGSGARNENISAPISSCVIEIPDTEMSQGKSTNVGSHSEDAMSVKSLFISLPEVIELVPKSASVLW